MFPALKQNHGAYTFKDDCQVETAAARWLMTQYILTGNRKRRSTIL